MSWTFWSVLNDYFNVFYAVKKFAFPGWGPDRNGLWSDHPRQNWPLIRPSQTGLTSDQTRVRSKLRVHLECARKLPLIRLLCARMSPPDQTSGRLNPPLIRLKCARSRLWSDWSALEIASDQTEVRSKSPLIRLKCARNCLWSDWSALEIASDQTEVRSKLPLIRLKCVQNSLIRERFEHEKNSQYCYNIFI